MKQRILVNTDHIQKQAELIRDIVQQIIDACQEGKPLDSFARNKVTGGSLAQDSAVLGIMIVQNELEGE